MKELDFINIIKKVSENNHLIGDDCAYLEELGIYITQDTLVEDVHFSLDTTSAYLLGKKAVNVNLSDLAAALAQPIYITVSISLPKTIKECFVEELYKGINEVCKKYNIKIAGGDITGSEKVVISICAIGKKISNYTTSRSFAKNGDYIILTGTAGASAAGLYALQNFLQADKKLIDAHINPEARIDIATKCASVLENNITAMDTSDGLIDALYKISQSSKHSVEIDINKVPIDDETMEFCNNNNLNYKELIKWGAEDYELILCVNQNTYEKMDKKSFTHIGRVLNKDTNPTITIKDNSNTEQITKEIFENNTFNHF